MDLQNMQNQCIYLVLSTDAKPRLKWTPELHQLFIEAINQLGGADKATPKSLMSVMRVPGLSLYHLKSHLQKYRLGKSQHLESFSDNKQDYREVQSSGGHCSREISTGTKDQMTESLKTVQALQMQMEVQRKLHQQIEVQRRLQLRIEAQGKYLQSVLRKAQEALAGHNSSTMGVELSKAELSQLLMIINNACPSSPMSELTETTGLNFNGGERKRKRGTVCSLGSSLTSSESSGREEEKQPMEETEKPKENFTLVPTELPFMFIPPEDKASNADTSNEATERKRTATTDSDGNCVEQPCGKRCGNKLGKFELLEQVDLSSQHQKDIDISSKDIDLNCSLSF